MTSPRRDEPMRVPGAVIAVMAADKAILRYYKSVGGLIIADEVARQIANKRLRARAR